MTQIITDKERMVLVLMIRFTGAVLIKATVHTDKSMTKILKQSPLEHDHQVCSQVLAFSTIFISIFYISFHGYLPGEQINVTERRSESTFAQRGEGDKHL